MGVAVREAPAWSSAREPRELTRPPAWRRAFLAHGAALLLFTLLTLTRAWSMVLHPAGTITPDPIDPLHTIWAVDASLQNVLHGRHGLWSLYDANIYYPTPHAAAYGDTFIGLLPFSLPLHLLLPNPVALSNVLLALSFILSAYGAFLLGHLLTGSYAAGLLAGLIYGFAPLRTEQAGHLDVLSTQWQVLAAYALVWAWQSGRWPWWVAAGVGAGLCGVTNLYYPAYLAVPLLLTAVVLWRDWTPARRHGALLAGALAGALILPALLPYALRHAAFSAQYGGAGSLDLFSFVQVLPGRPIDSALLPVVPLAMMQPDHGLFPGIVPLALALLAWRRRRGLAWGAFALASAVLALGSNLNLHGRILPLPLPYAWLNALVPGFALFRDPTRATMGLYLGVAVLAAWGARDALAALALPSRRAVLGVALIGLTALELWSPLPVLALPAIPRGEYWIARQARIHVVAELPIANTTPLDWQRELEIMYDATIHERQLINGSGSTDPAGMPARRAVLATYPAPAALRLLRSLHVDALVLRRGWLTPGQWANAITRCRVAYQDSQETICRPPW